MKRLIINPDGWPCKFGELRPGCVYSTQGFPSNSVYVYRTKTQVVVRGSIESKPSEPTP